MATEQNDAKDPKEKDTAKTDTSIEKGNTPTSQNKPDDTLPHTVAPDNDSGIPGPVSGEDEPEKKDE